MVARQVHLVRHGEVANPNGILYGRLPGFGLSGLGATMAGAGSDDLAARGRDITSLAVSPLQRTRESAAPIAVAFGVEPHLDDRLIEPTNRFEGLVMHDAVRNPKYWPFLLNPFRPGWGEAYRSIANRMRATIDDAFATPGDGDVVLVSHQLPIWITHLDLAGKRFMHDPRNRRCALSSITTIERGRTGKIVEVGYVDPGAALSTQARDVGAV